MDLEKHHYLLLVKKGNGDIVKYIIALGADINIENKNNEIALFETCSSGNKAVVKYLIEEHGADLNKVKKIE